MAAGAKSSIFCVFFSAVSKTPVAAGVFTWREVGCGRALASLCFASLTFSNSALLLLGEFHALSAVTYDVHFVAGCKRPWQNG